MTDKPFTCHHCGQPAACLVSIAPSIVRDACGACQGSANNRAFLDVQTARNALKGGKPGPTAEQLSLLALNGFADEANAYIATHGFPGAAVRDRTSDSTD